MLPLLVALTRGPFKFTVVLQEPSMDFATSLAGKAGGTQLRWYLRPFILLKVGIVVPLLLAFAYVRRFGVNVPENDEWFFIPTLEAFYSGKPWFHLVLSHYTEHRLIFPKLLMLGMSQLTHFNVKSEMYVSVLLMAVCALLLWRLVLITGMPRWVIIPAGFLLLSPAQLENMLVGWQLAIPMGNAFFLGMVVLLSEKSFSWPRWTAAAACAVGATFSFATGPAAWLVGGFLMIEKTRERRYQIVAWIGLALAIALFYRWDYPGARDVPPDYLSFWLRPVATAKLFFALLGNNFGGMRVSFSILAGAVLLALTVITLFVHRKTARPGLRPWYGLLLFSLMAAALVAVGRSFAWEVFAPATRYMTVTVFVPIGVLVIGAALLQARGVQPPAKWYAGIYSASVAVGVLLALVTAAKGWRAGDVILQDRLTARACLLNYRYASSDCLKRMFAYGGEIVRKEAVTLEKYKLGPFHSRRSSASEFK